MNYYLHHCCAVFFTLFSFLFAPIQSAQAETREAYVILISMKKRSHSTTTQRATLAPGTFGKSEDGGSKASWSNEIDQGAKFYIKNIIFDESFKDYLPTSTNSWLRGFDHVKKNPGN